MSIVHVPVEQSVIGSALNTLVTHHDSIYQTTFGRGCLVYVRGKNTQENLYVGFSSVKEWLEYVVLDAQRSSGPMLCVELKQTFVIFVVGYNC